MSDLFGREVSINIGGTLLRTQFVEGRRAPILKATFKIVKSSKKEPNAVDVTIFNLKQDNRTKFQEKGLPTIIEAGYIGATSRIFSGDLTFGQNRWDGTDWVTSLQAGDGTKAYSSARINLSLKGPVPIGDVLRNAAEAMGIDLGNVPEKIAEGSIRGALSELTNGAVLSGKAEQHLDKVVKSMGYSWSIQDGGLQLLGPDEAISPAGQNAVLLSSGTGMIGSPEAGEDGFVKVRSLLQPDLLPGRKIKVESKNGVVNGFFRVEKATFIGDTWGGDWFVDVEGKPLQ